MRPGPGARTNYALRLALLCLALLVATLVPRPVGAREIVVEDVNNPGKHDEVVPTVGDSGWEDDEDEEGQRDDYEGEDEAFHRLRRQMREIIVEDVSNPGKHDEVVPTVGDSGWEHDEDTEDEEEDEMQEETDWNPFAYRRLQDLPGSTMTDVLANWTNPPNADDHDAWKQDMEEIMGLIESAVEREAGDSIEAHVGPDGQVEETGAFAHIMNALSKSPDTLFPMCSPVGIAARLHLLCAITVISARIIIRGPPDFEKLANEHHCPNPGHHLPEPLEELSEKEDGTLTPVPFLIDQDIIARERPTYAWYARHVFNMYAYCFKYADDILTEGKQDFSHTLRPITPANWGGQDIYFVRYPSGYKWPIGQSIKKGDHMVVIFRGSLFPGDWVTDYQFPWADKATSEAFGIPGRVHRGFFNFASQFFEEFQHEVDLDDIKHVTFTGHSLGGAIATLAAAFMTKHHYYLQIDAVTFGSPAVGDREFTDYLNRKVNLRRVAYLGSGQLDIPEEKHMVYGFGDIVTQMPLACEGVSVPACKGLDFAPDTEGLGSFPYAISNGNVPFYARDLRNTEGWLKHENYVFGARKFIDIPQGVMASHICSYQCWTAMVTGDPDDRCFFPEDAGADPRYLCAVDFSDTMPKRWPLLNNPPETDLEHEGNVAEEKVKGWDQRRLRSSS